MSLSKLIKRKRKDKIFLKIGISPIVSTIILVSITLLIGFIIMGFTMGWSLNSSREYGLEINKAIAQQKSNLLIEHVQIINNNVYIYLYNIGKIPLRVVSVNIFKLGETEPSPKYELKTFIDGSTLLDISEFKILVTSIDPSLIGNSLVIKVYAIASTIFDPFNPGKNIEWGVIVDYLYNA
jgi:hypothetical protein